MQWSLQPAGKQLKVGDFPVNIALHPSEPFAAVLHCGWGEHEIVTVDLKKFDIIARIKAPEYFYGLCFTPDGKSLYVSGGQSATVYRYTFAKGYLSDPAEIKLAQPKDKNVLAGVALSPDGGTLYACVAWGDRLAVVPTAQPDKPEFVELTKDDYPYAALPTADNARVYLSLWGRGAVSVYDTQAKKIVADWPVSPHPTEMLLSADGARLFVACANSTNVEVLDAKTGAKSETISTALYPNAPNGSTPSSLALSGDGKVLFIVNSDNNNLAVVDVSTPGKSRSLGFIPTGWYPTSVRYDAKQDRLFVANGKGLMSKANPHGPNPNVEPPKSVREYIGGLFNGTLCEINMPTPAGMNVYTRKAYECSPLRADLLPSAKPRDPRNPIPAKVGDPSPIKYCIYIIKENRTYDQVFGDVREGNGDPHLCLFPEHVTPNHHALVRQFVLLDNFYVESEVSADGHEWSMAAYATDFTEKTWPLQYRGGGHGVFRYPAEGGLPVAYPSSGYLWDRCRESKVSFRSYGEFISNGKKPDEPGKARLASLDGHFDPLYRSFDMDYPDAKRADRFLAELKEFETKGDLPRLIILRLPNDHTSGTALNKPTPIAHVGDNDLALGRVIEGLTQSKFWKQMAVFVVEDDAQNGSDHVDAHRTVAMVFSPYCKRKSVDSNMYSTSSMLRTMELILGLPPMTQFDAAALPMYASFQPEPDLSGYKHLPANVDLTAKNTTDSFGWRESSKFDFSQEDAVDDLALNRVIWYSIKGVERPMPAPVRASFVYQPPVKKLDDDDDD